MIKRAYICGVQDALIDQGVVKYATSEEAMQDASMMAQAMDANEVEPSQMAEGVQDEATAGIATAIVQMATDAKGQADEAAAKADIAVNAVQELVKTQALKTASDVAPEEPMTCRGSTERKVSFRVMRDDRPDRANRGPSENLSGLHPCIRVIPQR